MGTGPREGGKVGWDYSKGGVSGKGGTGAENLSRARRERCPVGALWELLGGPLRVREQEPFTGALASGAPP